MIVRLWRGSAVMGSDAQAYESHVTGKVFPGVLALSGNLGVRLLKRRIDDRIEFLAVTYWSSLEAVKAFAGDDIGLAVVDPAAHAVLAEFDDFVTHYEVAYGAGPAGTNCPNAKADRPA